MRACLWFVIGVHVLAVPALHAETVFSLQPNPHWRTELQSQSAEMAERQKAAARTAGQLGCATQCARLAAIFHRLRAVTDHQLPASAGHTWALVVTRQPGMQAWALPDGQVFVSEDFIQREQLSDAELALVLAHEIAHVALAHEADTVDIVRRLMPFGLSASVADVYAALDFDLGLLLQVAPLLADMERDADHLGLLLAALAGYDPDQAIGLLRKFAAQGEARAMIATHPASAARLQAAEVLLPVARRLYERHRELRR